MNERELFLQAIELTDATQRDAFLDAQCGNDDGLRTRVQQLLLAHDASASFLENPQVEGLGDCVQEWLADSLDQAPAVAESPHLYETREMVRPLGGDDALETEALSCEFLKPYLSPTEVPESLGRIGHYEIFKVIGRGGCGVVLRGYDTKLHRTVAIKWMTPELAQTSPARKRFLREARAAAAVAHQNVVRIYAVEEQPVPHLVMEFIAGTTLQHRLEQAGPFELDEVHQLGLQIAQGLAASHAQGLIHRDIKPANILLEQGTNQVKLTDFGLARAVDDASLTRSGMVSGTPLYMSPEQAQGQRVDQRSDLFSFGSVLYAMCTGRPPFRAGNAVAILRRVVDDKPRPIQEVIHEIPNWLVQIIEKLHAKNPDDRYETAAELIVDWTRKAKQSEHQQPFAGKALNSKQGNSSAEKVASAPSPRGRTMHQQRNAWLVAGLAAFIALATIVYAWNRRDQVADTVVSSATSHRDNGIDAEPFMQNAPAGGATTQQTAKAPPIVIDNPLPAFNDFVEAHGLTEDQLTAWVDELPPSYVPIWFSPRRHIDPPLYDIVAVNQGLPDREPKIEFIHNAWQPDGWPNDETCDAYLQRVATMGRSNHYTVLRALSGESVGILTMLGPDEFAFWFTERDFITEKLMENMKYERQNKGIAERFLPLSLNVGVLGEATNHEVVLTYLPYVDCNWHWSLTAEQLLFRMEYYKEKGWRPHIISTNSGTSETLFTAVFMLSEVPSPWAFSHDISEADYEAMLVSKSAEGGRPRCVNSWVHSGETRYSVIWDAKP